MGDNQSGKFSDENKHLGKWCENAVGSLTECLMYPREKHIKVKNLPSFVLFDC